MRVHQMHENKVEYAQNAMDVPMADNLSIKRRQTQILPMLESKTMTEEMMLTKNKSFSVVLRP